MITPTVTDYRDYALRERGGRGGGGSDVRRDQGSAVGWSIIPTRRPGQGFSLTPMGRNPDTLPL